MFLLSIQELTIEAVTLVSKRKLSQASELLVSIIGSIQERRRCEPFSPAQSSKSPESFEVKDIFFLPVSKECKVACPGWDADFFNLPFASFTPERCNASEQVVTESIADACIGVCLYMLGLCYQLDAREQDKYCPDVSLRAACGFYGHAWSTLKRCGNSCGGDSSISFILMAISTNMIKCHYDLGELDLTNGWMGMLRDLLKCCWIKEERLTVEIHNFFLVVSSLNTRFVAAGAA